MERQPEGHSVAGYRTLTALVSILNQLPDVRRGVQQNGTQCAFRLWWIIRERDVVD
jgi:hypothetical protein